MSVRNIALVLSILDHRGLDRPGVFTRGLNLGVDFVGGQVVRVTFVQPADSSSTLRDQVDSLGRRRGEHPGIRRPNVIAIRMPLPEGGEEAASRTATQVRDLITSRYQGARIDRRSRSVSGKVSNELFRSGSLAVALAMLGIAVYIWIRFEWQFGIGALVTLFHDVCDDPRILLAHPAAKSTSTSSPRSSPSSAIRLNDTVVIYDRIRENLRKYRKMEIVPLLNLSLNETLSRTMVTQHVDHAGPARPADPRPGRDLRPHHRDLHRHLRRHLFVDLHLLADPGHRLKVSSGRLHAEGSGDPRRRTAQRGFWCPRLSATNRAAGPLVQGFSANGFLVDGRAYRWPAADAGAGDGVGSTGC